MPAEVGGSSRFDMAGDGGGVRRISCLLSKGLFLLLVVFVFVFVVWFILCLWVPASSRYLNPLCSYPFL